MNRNNFLPHVALALVLLLVAAFAGQLRRWQHQWKHVVRIMPATDKTREAVKNAEMATTEPREFGEAEVLVKFKPGVSAESIRKITSRLHDRVADTIESVPGLEAIE